MAMSVTLENLDVVVSGLETATLEVREGAFQGVLLALNAAFKACEQMLSPMDHSLRDLAMMGHPYGFTHPAQVNSPDEMVNFQTGRYRAALEKVTPSGQFGDIIGGQIQIGDDMADLDRWIQEGTTKMRARPWMQYIVDHFGQDFAEVVVQSVEAAVRKSAAA